MRLQAASNLTAARDMGALKQGITYGGVLLWVSWISVRERPHAVCKPVTSVLT